jgi:hypothetical protein
MSILVQDSSTKQRIRKQPHHPDRSQWDEMWEGVRVVPPISNNEHQEIQFKLSEPILEVVTVPNLGFASAGVNVSDRNRGWMKSVRRHPVLPFSDN